MSTVFDMEDLPTPAVVIDMPRVRRNIARMADYCRQHGIKLRPHTKTHKSRLMARLQLEAGASGLTVAKAGEAEVMGELCDDLLVAYPALDPIRTDRLARLAAGVTVRVAIDSTFAADRLAERARSAGTTLGILVDLDVGPHRTGVQTPADALTLAQHVSATTGLRLDGLFCYPGHVHEPPQMQREPLAAVSAMLAETLSLWKHKGLAAPIVSGGSTPTAMQSHLIPQITEIRPGTYIFYDSGELGGGYCTIDDCAARVVCTVVSNAVPEKFVLDAGSKSLTQDRAWSDPSGGFGRIVEYPAAKVIKLSEEHAEVDASHCDHRPRLGERVTVIPNHICPCINLHDAVWLREENETKLCRLPVDARGRVN